MARPYRITIKIIVDREAFDLRSASLQAHEARRQAIAAIGGYVVGSQIVEVEPAERRRGGDRRKAGQ